MLYSAVSRAAEAFDSQASPPAFTRLESSLADAGMVTGQLELNSRTRQKTESATNLSAEGW